MSEELSGCCLGVREHSVRGVEVEVELEELLEVDVGGVHPECTLNYLDVPFLCQFEPLEELNEGPYIPI